MAATYDKKLTTFKDLVRLLTGDTDMSAPLLDDEEINAVLERYEINKVVSLCLLAIANDPRKVLILRDATDKGITVVEWSRELESRALAWEYL